MIKISSPQISTRNGLCYVSCRIASDSMKLDEEIWYRSEAQYGRYFVNETADAFVLPMLLLALKNQEDVEIQAPLSEKLYYNITNNILYTLAIPLKVKSDIKVSCAKLVNCNYGSSAVGCGCSLGVDSFSAMIRHTSENCPKGFRITHLTNFNVGAYGNVFEPAHDYFEQSLTDVRAYCEEVKKPLVTIESNFGVFFNGSGSFNWSGPVRTMSAALAMQKLFKRYYYASGTANEMFQYTTSTYDFASLLLPMLSTETTEIIVVDQDKNRIEKTASLVENPMAWKYLDVCWKKIKANRGDTSYLAYSSRNCTHCTKCIRTLLAIDILGDIDKFKNIFDVEYFKENKKKIVKDFIARKNVNHYYREIFDLMVEKEYEIPKMTIGDYLSSIVCKVKHYYSLLCSQLKKQ